MSVSGRNLIAWEWLTQYFILKLPDLSYRRSSIVCIPKIHGYSLSLWLNTTFAADLSELDPPSALSGNDTAARLFEDGARE